MRMTYLLAWPQKCMECLDDLPCWYRCSSRYRNRWGSTPCRTPLTGTHSGGTLLMEFPLISHDHWPTNGICRLEDQRSNYKTLEQSLHVRRHKLVAFQGHRLACVLLLGWWYCSCHDPEDLMPGKKSLRTNFSWFSEWQVSCCWRWYRGKHLDGSACLLDTNRTWQLEDWSPHDIQSRCHSLHWPHPAWLRVQDLIPMMGCLK